MKAILAVRRSSQAVRCSLKTHHPCCGVVVVCCSSPQVQHVGWRCSACRSVSGLAPAVTPSAPTTPPPPPVDVVVAGGAKKPTQEIISEMRNHPVSFELQKSHLHVEYERYFSTTAAPEAPDDSSLDELSSSSSSSAEISSSKDDGIMDQESDPHKLFETLGMKEAELYELAAQSPTPLRLSDMYKYATVNDKHQRLRNAQFLHRELPIRVAQRAVDLLTLPHGLSDAVPIRQVACAYIGKLHQMLSFPTPVTFKEEEQWTDLLQSMVLDRSSIPMAIARGVSAWGDDQQREAVDLKRLQEMEDALYRFFTARVGLRLLTEHHVLSCYRPSAKALRNVTCMFPDEMSETSGLIHSGLDLVHEVTRVAVLVVRQTTDFYGFSPAIEVIDCMDKRNTGDFTYIPHHLHYMMGELLKNSCRATVRHFAGDVIANGSSGGDNAAAAAATKPLGVLGRLSTPTLPPIRVVVVKGDEDVTVKVADKGGGIPRSRMAKIWKFAHSTAHEEESASAFGTDSLSGLKIRGFGLPLCRIYARYLGGELTLKSMEGYGLDAYLHLPRLGVACEKLPMLVRHSPGDRDSLPSRRNFSTQAGGGGGGPVVAAGASELEEQPRRQQHDNNNEHDNEENNDNQEEKIVPNSNKVPTTAQLLVEELRHCLTQEARNQRILDFLYSRAL